MRKPRLILTVALVCTMAYGALAEPTNAGVVKIVNVTNENSPTELIAGSTHTVSIQYDFTGLNGSYSWMGGNGFEVYSSLNPDGTGAGTADWVNLLAVDGPLVTGLPAEPGLRRYHKYYTSTDGGASYTWTPFVPPAPTGFPFWTQQPGGSSGANSRVAYSLVVMDDGLVPIDGFIAGSIGIALDLEFQTRIEDIGKYICIDTMAVVMAWEWASGSLTDWPTWDNGSGDPDPSGPRCWQIVAPDGFTPSGVDVEVQVSDILTVTFANVIPPGGITTVVEQTTGPGLDGYQILPQSQPVYYSIETTAGYTGDITVCFEYDDTNLDPGVEAALTLQHYTGTVWVDITSAGYPDVANNIICGVTTTLSPFVLAAPRTSCCSGRVGDANNSGEDEPSIGDVAELVDHLFIDKPPLVCVAEADVNQSGGADPSQELPDSDITIGDVADLVDYLFITGPEEGVLPDCL